MQRLERRMGLWDKEGRPSHPREGRLPRHRDMRAWTQGTADTHGLRVVSVPRHLAMALKSDHVTHLFEIGPRLSRLARGIFALGLSPLSTAMLFTLFSLNDPLHHSFLMYKNRELHQAPLTQFPAFFYREPDNDHQHLLTGE